MSVQPTARPIALVIVDRPNWAHDRKTDALSRELSARYDFVRRYHADVTAADLERADVILLYYWLQLERLAPLREVFLRRRDRLAIGVCSHFELQGAWREPGLATLNDFARCVFANNRLLLAEFGSEITPPLHYTPNGVDTNFFSPSTADRVVSTGPLRVGWAGSLTNQGPEHRGVNECIIPAIEAAGAKPHLAIREERWRNRDEMLDFYRNIDVYVCASRSEGTPNGCLEASACGVPIITTRVGNMPELIRDGENGFFVERDVNDIAGRISQLSQDPALRARMGQAARIAVESWDWKHQARRYAAMLETILERDR